MKKAFITGIAGQDGSYLSELLLSKGYEVYGLDREGSNLENVPKGVKLLYGDLGDHDSLREALKKSEPDEVYNLAGVSDLKTAFEQPEKTLEINYNSVGILLKESLKVNKNIRFLQASSSEIFAPSRFPFNENSKRDWETNNPYAKAKMMADRDFIQKLRKEKNVFACSAILFNHESPMRPAKFVSRKIINTLVKIKFGIENCLSVGNLDMCRDWGFAGDYTDAMWRMLQRDVAEDLVIASGKVHRVKDFIEIAARILDMKLTWYGEGVNAYASCKGKKIVEVVTTFYKPTEKYFRIGDISKAKHVIDFEPKINFEELVKMMVKFDITELNEHS
ncbi:MAG TPA: GDP-mannose 4,6-dehydratase [Candidatus Paceibacterota bacterium]